MKTAEALYYDDIISILDPYHDCSEEEVESGKDIFVLAIKEKDMDFINDVISSFDEELEEDKEVIENIKYLIKE